MAGADVTTIESLIALLRAGTPVLASLKELNALVPATEFVSSTWPPGSKSATSAPSSATIESGALDGADW
jgi:hypothetical protein